MYDRFPLLSWLRKLRENCRQLCKNILAGEEFQRILPQGQRWTEELHKYLDELVKVRKDLRAGLNLPVEVSESWLTYLSP